jgi:hypothetical protein
MMSRVNRLRHLDAELEQFYYNFKISPTFGSPVCEIWHNMAWATFWAISRRNCTFFTKKHLVTMRLRPQSFLFYLHTSIPALKRKRHFQRTLYNLLRKRSMYDTSVTEMDKQAKCECWELGQKAHIPGYRYIGCYACTRKTTHFCSHIFAQRKKTVFQVLWPGLPDGIFSNKKSQFG